MRIAVLGTGLMGQPLARRLLGAGHAVTVWNRDPKKARPLADGGAKLATTPEQALADTEGVVLMLTDMDAIIEVLWAPSVRVLLPGKTVIQMATIAPAQSEDLERRLAVQGCAYLEAPVLGSIPEAREGTLILMVGGEEPLFRQWSELLRCFGPKPLYIGRAGQAAAMKLALNQLIAGLTTSFAQSLGLVRRAGIDVDQFMEVLRDSAVYAPTFEKKLGRMLQRDYGNPNFPTRHLLKDVDLFLDQARSDGLRTPMLEGLRRTLEQAMEQGLADEDYSALYEAVDPP